VSLFAKLPNRLKWQIDCCFACWPSLNCPRLGQAQIIRIGNRRYVGEWERPPHGGLIGRGFTIRGEDTERVHPLTS